MFRVWEQNQDTCHQSAAWEGAWWSSPGAPVPGWVERGLGEQIPLASVSSPGGPALGGEGQRLAACPQERRALVLSVLRAHQQDRGGSSGSGTAGRTRLPGVPGPSVRFCLSWALPTSASAKVPPLHSLYRGPTPGMLQ